MRHAFAVGALVALLTIGCGPKEMGEKAPAYGSSAKVATTAGFLMGRWMRKVDRSSIPKGAPDLSALSPKAFIEFTSNHTCTFDCEHHLVHLTWSEVTNGVALKALDVDGEPIAKVDGEFKKLMNSNSLMMSSDSHAMARTAALMFASMVNKLELMPDKKRMVESDTAGVDGNNILGMDTWVRLES